MNRLLFFLFVCSSAAAQPVHIVVPFTPGGNVDIVARIVAQGLSEETRQNFIVENKPGANAAIGADYVARAAPNGQTLLFATAETHALNPHLQKKLSYDPLKDFATIGVVDQFPFSLVVSPKLPVATLGEFIAHAKKNHGKLNFASWGNGSTSQIAFEQLQQSTGINLVHVPFQGAGTGDHRGGLGQRRSVHRAAFGRAPAGGERAREAARGHQREARGVGARGARPRASRASRWSSPAGMSWPRRRRRPGARLPR